MSFQTVLLKKRSLMFRLDVFPFIIIYAILLGSMELDTILF